MTILCPAGTHDLESVHVSDGGDPFQKDPLPASTLGGWRRIHGAPLLFILYSLHSLQRGIHLLVSTVFRRSWPTHTHVQKILAPSHPGKCSFLGSSPPCITLGYTRTGSTHAHNPALLALSCPTHSLAGTLETCGEGRPEGSKGPAAASGADVPGDLEEKFYPFFVLNWEKRAVLFSITPFFSVPPTPLPCHVGKGLS